MEKSLCIIPARSGSKSIRDKNLQLLEGKTLVRIAVEKAYRSRLFSRIIISTDYNRNRLGLEDMGTEALTQIILAKRPPELATDTAHAADVARHILNGLGGPEKWIWYVQPTSPFSSIDDFKKLHEILSSGKYDGAMSFRPTKEYIDRTYTWKNDKAYRFNQSNFNNKQELKSQVHRSGNFYILKREGFFLKDRTGKLDNDCWDKGNIYPMMMGWIDPGVATQEQLVVSRRLGTNIDDIDDYRWAKHLVSCGDAKCWVSK